MHLLNCKRCVAWMIASVVCTGCHLSAEKGLLPGLGDSEAGFNAANWDEDTNDSSVGVSPATGNDTSIAELSSFAVASNVPMNSDATIRLAVEKAHAVLWKGVEGHAEHRDCFTCHNHGVPILAFSTARDHGFSIPENDLSELVEFSTAYFEKYRERLLRGRGPGPLSLGGATDTTGWGLFALAVAGKKPDAVTAAAVEYTLQRDQDRDHWTAWGPSRPPAEGSEFMPTALSIRGLRAFGLPEHQERIVKRVEAARGWLLKTPPADTEDRVFRLLGLQAVGAAPTDIRCAAADLVRTQRPDGGWGQIDGVASDAYATGSALAALQMGADMPVADPVYQRGVMYLLQSQLDDGSWQVWSRSFRFQPYYESGFPHGRNQFISCAATAWAATALALALPKDSDPDSRLPISSRLQRPPDEVSHRPDPVRQPDSANRQ